MGDFQERCLHRRRQETKGRDSPFLFPVKVVLLKAAAAIFFTHEDGLSWESRKMKMTQVLGDPLKLLYHKPYLLTSCFRR